jgi:hypothetical protein
LSPTRKALALFVALTAAGVGLIALAPLASVELIRTTLPLIETAFFTASLAFFLVRESKQQAK